MAGRSIEWEDQGPEGLKRAAQLLSPKGQTLPPRSLSQSSCMLRLLWKPGPQAFLPTQLPKAGAGRKGAECGDEGLRLRWLCSYPTLWLPVSLWRQ